MGEYRATDLSIQKIISSTLKVRIFQHINFGLARRFDGTRQKNNPANQ